MNYMFFLNFILLWILVLFHVFLIGLFYSSVQFCHTHLLFLLVVFAQVSGIWVHYTLFCILCWFVSSFFLHYISSVSPGSDPCKFLNIVFDLLIKQLCFRKSIVLKVLTCTLCQNRHQPWLFRFIAKKDCYDRNYPSNSNFLIFLYFV